MGRYFDFCVRFDKDKDTPEELTKRILYSLFIQRIKAKKPVVAFIGADSGEGKSYSTLRLMELLLELQGINIRDVLDDVNVFTPIEYPVKLNNLLFPSETKKHYQDKLTNEELEKKLRLLKKVNVICMHEAREIVKAKNWHTFLNQAISDVNAMSRSIKRLCFFVISQFIRDISSDIRYTLNYYITIHRPLGKKARLTISVLWKDDSDLERPRLKKRRIKGYLVDSKGRYRIYQPKYLELTKPSKDIREAFKKRDFESKAMIIRKKIERLVSELKVEMQIGSAKVDAMVNWYVKNQENLNLIGKRFRGKWKVKPEVKVMHELTDSEGKEFESKLNERMKELKMLGEKEENGTE